jgi:hypothetical protein
VRGRGGAAGDHERAQRWQLGVDLVAGVLKPVRVVRPDAQPLPPHPAICRRRHRQVGADVEQVILHAAQPRREGLGQAGLQQRHADHGIQLIDRAVGLHARVQLGHPAHVAEMRLAVVSEPGVDAGEVYGHGSIRNVPALVMIRAHP